MSLRARYSLVQWQSLGDVGGCSPQAPSYPSWRTGEQPRPAMSLRARYSLVQWQSLGDVGGCSPQAPSYPSWRTGEQ
ncbi:hypothetical protein J6590_106340, partial [Homalodisca vitripennis]